MKKTKTSKAPPPTFDESLELSRVDVEIRLFPLSEKSYTPQVALGKEVSAGDKEAAEDAAEDAASSLSMAVNKALRERVLMEAFQRAEHDKGLDCLLFELMVKPRLADMLLFPDIDVAHQLSLALLAGNAPVTREHRTGEVHVVIALRLSAAPGPAGKPTSEAPVSEPEQVTARLDFESLFRHYHKRIHDAEAPLVQELDAALQGFVGHSFKSLDLNRRFASELQRLLNRLGLRVRCPECKRPARLRCTKAGTARHGAFQFSHRIEGHNTNHRGSTHIPSLRLIPAPPDKRRN
ncbi:MAG: hypothetical protein KAV82_07685 [Phycisphaerae bacterium]|nr:hypothetical protein [Phycisphaerae bacterium]